MIRLSLVFLVVGTVAVLGSTVPGEYLEWEGRIVGGSHAASGQFPHQVSLRSANNAHFCGASIVNSRWVLSAAHCTVGRTSANTFVIVGTHLLNSGGFAHSVSLIVNHPHYNANSLQNDVSVVQTASLIAYNHLAQPIALAATYISTASGALASGWGQLGANVGAPNNLQWMSKRIITVADCRLYLPDSHAARVSDSNICSLSPTGQGMCMGDSGGPLIHDGLQQGIVSWGIPCGGVYPDVFTRVSSFRSWIVSITGL